MKNLFTKAHVAQSSAKKAIKPIPPSSLFPSVLSESDINFPSSMASSELPRRPSTAMSPFGFGNNPNRESTSWVRRYSQYANNVKPEDIEIRVLRPESKEDFQMFKQIITDEKVVFTSSWIDQKFGVKNLQEYCKRFAQKLELASLGVEGVVVAKNDLRQYREGTLSPTQIALNHFFNDFDKDNELREVYKGLTAKADENIGYYVFTDVSGKLVGGGALAPIGENEEGKTDTVDVALHILEAQKGIGTVGIHMLLKNAFEIHGIRNVWGSSVIQHPGTPTLCAKFGMRIVNRPEDNKKYYYIDQPMWRHYRETENVMNKPLAAAKTFFTPTDGSFSKS